MNNYAASPGGQEPSRGRSQNASPQAPRNRRRTSGLWHAWIVLTGPNDNAPQRTIEERGILRRARLSSGVMFGALILGLLLLPLGIEAPGHATLYADSLLFVAVFVAALLNRAGLTTLAGLVLVMMLLFAVTFAILAQPLDLIYLPGFDLLTLGILLAAAILPRIWIWVVGLTSSAFIIIDVILQPRTAALDAFISKNGSFAVSARPVAESLIAAIILFALVVFLEDESRRADLSEELADLERREIERNRELEQGVRELLAAHVQLANGNFNVRVPQISNTMLWQIGSSLNNLIGRLGRMGQSEFQLRRTSDESRRLAEALRAIMVGRQPIWPAPSGTPIDEVLEPLQRLLSRSNAGNSMQPMNPMGGRNAPVSAPSQFPRALPQPQQFPWQQQPAAPGTGQLPGHQQQPSFTSNDLESQLPDWLRTAMPPNDEPMTGRRSGPQLPGQGSSFGQPGPDVWDNAASQSPWPEPYPDLDEDRNGGMPPRQR